MIDGDEKTRRVSVTDTDRDSAARRPNRGNEMPTIVRNQRSAFERPVEIEGAATPTTFARLAQSIATQR